jgi:hypothetical protein
MISAGSAASLIDTEAQVAEPAAECAAVEIVILIRRLRVVSIRSSRFRLGIHLKMARLYLPSGRREPQRVLIWINTDFLASFNCSEHFASFRRT